jgi:hypothetical protein
MLISPDLVMLLLGQLFISSLFSRVLFTFITKYQIPSNLDWFGWCTWDAFYKAVNPSGIEEGLQRFARTNVHLEYTLRRASFASYS